MTELHYPNSPNFNEKNWIASREALAFANRPAYARVPSPIVAAIANAEAEAAKVTEAQIESAKVVNVETPEAMNERQRAELLGLTVKVLRAQCKAENLKRYSSAPKRTLVDMLLGSQSG